MKQGKKSDHPGVFISARKWGRAHSYYARFLDPDCEEMREVSMKKLGVHTAEGRRKWCIAKSEEIFFRRQLLARGARRKTETPLEDAMEEFFKHRAGEVKPKTLEVYRGDAREFQDWCGRNGIRYSEEITPAALMRYRGEYCSRGMKVNERGRRGRRSQSMRRRSPVSINSGLRGLRTVLNHIRSLDFTPQLTSDAIRDSLKYVKAQRGLPKFLQKHEIAALLDAAVAHDRVHFKETRAEHQGLGVAGSTPRYTPIAPLVLAALLTGCRISELLNLRWDQIQLHERRLALDAADTKTGRGRFVDLGITPTLRWMFSAMKRAAAGPFVFLGNTPYRKDLADSAKKRLIREFGVAKFTWHDLRRTCGTFLVCAPSVYGAASVFMVAKRLGHGVEVSERHYLGMLTTVSPKARRLERAMEVEQLCVDIAKGVGTRTPAGAGAKPPQLRLLRRA